MRRTLLTLALAAVAATAGAQSIRVWQGGESTRYAMSEASVYTYDDAGQTLTIGTKAYSVAEIDSITVVNPVTITWNGNTAAVNIPASVTGVTATVTAGNVVITNTNVWEEQEFVLSGTGTAGSLTYNGAYKCKFTLNGLNLTSTAGAAIDIQCGKRIDLILADGTTNSLTDAAGGTQKAAFNCQGHMEVSGSGSLTVAGNTAHAIRTNEYLLLKKSTGTIAVTKAASDGIHVGEFFQMNGGTVTISGTAKDGLQVETDDESDEELNGQLIINDGTLTVRVENEDVKAIRLDAAETNTAIVPEMSILGGTVTVVVASTADGSRGIASDGNITIGNGKANAPVVDVTVSAGVFTDPDTDEDNRATGIKADNTLLIAGGVTTVAANGTKSRGVRAATLRATAGTLTVTRNSSSQGIKLDNQIVVEGGTVNSDNIKY